MNVTLLDLAAVGPAELGRWRELAARALEPNPFYEPEYVLPLARGLGQIDDVGLLVVSDRDEWTALTPVRSGSWHRIPLPSMASWRGHLLYGLLGTPLVAADRAADALPALVHGMLTSERVSYAALEWVGGGGPVASVLDATLAARRPRALTFERFERAALWRRPEPTYVLETLGSKRRRELRRQRRKLGEALGAEPVTVDRAGTEAAYGEFVALEAASAKGAYGTVVGADAGHRAFFKDMCRSFAEIGRLQLLSLQAGDRTIASKCNLIAGDGIFCFKIAYDERWAKLSPGIQLELDMLSIFHESQDANFMDSCADPNNKMINRLWPDRRELTSHVVPTSGLVGRGVAPALAAARTIRDRRNSRRNEDEPTT